MQKFSLYNTQVVQDSSEQLTSTAAGACSLSVCVLKILRKKKEIKREAKLKIMKPKPLH